MEPNWLRVLAGALFPAVCPGCGGRAEPVCAACLATFRPAVRAAPPPGVDAWVAPFAYEGAARELVARAKYGGRHAALRWVAARMVDAWGAADGAVPDVVTWVPTTAGHRRARGVDHARALGRAVAAGLGVPARALLVRGPGPPQTGRPAHERRAGPRVHASARVRGTVLVVDDVATTGASLRVCAAALRAAGADHVVALTAARTPRRDPPVSAPARPATARRAASPRRRDAIGSA